MTWLINNFRSMIILFLLLIWCAGIAASGIKRYSAVKALAASRLETINDMQRRQKSLAALDAKYTQELADAQVTINQLHDDVAAGRRRLQFNATCQRQSAATPGSLGDATSPRPADTIERDYFTLRERVETVTKQVSYLQQYIREQCLK